MERHELYNGEITLHFDPDRYTYHIDNQVVPGVTGVVGVIDRSGPLMGWAVNQAVDYLRESFKAGVKYDEVELENFLREAKSAHRCKSRESAMTGEIVHRWIQAKIRGQSPFPFNEHARPLHHSRRQADWRT